MPGKGSIRETRRPVSEEAGRDLDKPDVARRRLLTGGGVVVAGVVGAGVASAVAAPAGAAAGAPVLQDTVNSAGTSATPTELDADNATTPAFIVNNTGVDTSTTPSGAGPALRLTPSAETVPTASAAGGDLTATAGGDLWFSHAFGGTPPVVTAPVHTEATANVYAPLGAPSRILDTRSASGRTAIVNPSGNLDSAGRLIAGKTIFINLDSLVFFGEVVFANVTATGTTASGFLTVWSGAGTRPVVSTIDWPAANTSLANFLASAIAELSTTVVNVIAIFTNSTTHVLLDVAGFMMPGFEYAKFKVGGAAAASSASRASRLQRAQQAIRASRA